MSPDGEDVIEHHRSTEYRIFDHGLQHDGFTITVTGERVRFTGVCPGCGGRTSFTWDHGLPGHKSGSAPDRESPDLGDHPRTLFCECGFTHAERPPDAWDRGCGAFWQVKLVIDQAEAT